MSPEAKQETIKRLFAVSQECRIGKIESITFDSHDMPTVKYFVMFADNLPKLAARNYRYKYIDSYRIQFLSW